MRSPPALALAGAALGGALLAGGAVTSLPFGGEALERAFDVTEPVAQLARARQLVREPLRGAAVAVTGGVETRGHFVERASDRRPLAAR